MRAPGRILLLLFTARTSLKASIQYAYDESGRLIAVAVPSGDTAVHHYDAVRQYRYASTQLSRISLAWLGMPENPVPAIVTGVNSGRGHKRRSPAPGAPGLPKRNPLG